MKYSKSYLKIGIPVFAWGFLFFLSVANLSHAGQAAPGSKSKLDSAQQKLKDAKDALKKAFDESKAARKKKDEEKQKNGDSSVEANMALETAQDKLMNALQAESDAENEAYAAEKETAGQNQWDPGKQFWDKQNRKPTQVETPGGPPAPLWDPAKAEYWDKSHEREMNGRIHDLNQRDRIGELNADIASPQAPAVEVPAPAVPDTSGDNKQCPPN